MLFCTEHDKKSSFLLFRAVLLRTRPVLPHFVRKNKIVVAQKNVSLYRGHLPQKGKNGTDFPAFVKTGLDDKKTQLPFGFIGRKKPIKSTKKEVTMRKLALSDEILLSIQQPARYIGGEMNMVVKDPSQMDIRFCMCFPDVYEIGMSHLGIQILYDMFNRREDVYCERVYSPWTDLDRLMREKKIPLFALESQDPVKDFDFLGITLQYEMCYTNVLQILDLSQIPLHASERTDEYPIVIGGGPCAYNPEPLADFFDLFYIGEGETVYDQLLDAYKKNKTNGGTRHDFLEMAARIPGIYVPAFYDVTYNEDGTIRSFLPNNPNAKETITKELAVHMDDYHYIEKPVVPFIKVTQDRVVLEIQRGCIRGCRFCQAGNIYRPLRERSLEYLKEYAYKLLKSTGHEEISLSSLRHE